MMPPLWVSNEKTKSGQPVTDGDVVIKETSRVSTWAVSPITYTMDNDERIELSIDNVVASHRSIKITSKSRKA